MWLHVGCPSKMLEPMGVSVESHVPENAAWVSFERNLEYPNDLQDVSKIASWIISWDIRIDFVLGIQNCSNWEPTRRQNHGSLSRNSSKTVTSIFVDFWMDLDWLRE